MFRLNDAVRRYQAQHRSPSELRCVAAVAPPTSESIDLAQLIEQLQEEGACLLHSESALLIRPTHWAQLDNVSPHWKALLLHLQTNDQGENNGAGRSA